MPHVVVELWTGKSDAQKQALTDAVREVTDTLDYRLDAVSMGFEEVAPDEWAASVYEPDIEHEWDTLTKAPGYGRHPKSPARKAIK